MSCSKLNSQAFRESFLKSFSSNFYSPPGLSATSLATWMSFTNTLIGRVPNFSPAWYAGLVRNIVSGSAGVALNGGSVGSYVSLAVGVLSTFTPFTMPYAVSGILAGLILSSLADAVSDPTSRHDGDCDNRPFPPTHPGRWDPLVVDLNGDGVKLTPLAGTKVNFDFGADGFA